MITEADRIAIIAATLREAALCARDLADGWESELVRRFQQRAIFLEREAEQLRDSEKPFRDAETMAMLRNMRTGTSEAELLKASADREARQAADMTNSRRGAIKQAEAEVVTRADGTVRMMVDVDDHLAEVHALTARLTDALNELDGMKQAYDCLKHQAAAQCEEDNRKHRGVSPGDDRPSDKGSVTCASSPNGPPGKNDSGGRPTVAAFVASTNGYDCTVVSRYDHERLVAWLDKQLLRSAAIHHTEVQKERRAAEEARAERDAAREQRDAKERELRELRLYAARNERRVREDATAARAEAADKALAEEKQHCDWLRKELAGVREDVKRLIGHAETAEKALAEERAGAAVLRAALEAYEADGEGRDCGACIQGCERIDDDGYASTCKRRSDALAGGAGQELLEAARAVVLKRTWCATLARKLRELDRTMTAAAVDDLGTDIDKLARAIGREP